MATTLLGRIEEFDGSKEADWQLYVERLAHFFIANGITDEEKKRVVFLSVIGAGTYKTLRNILSPEKPGDKTYGADREALATFSPSALRSVSSSTVDRGSRVSLLPRSLQSYDRCLNSAILETLSTL